MALATLHHFPTLQPCRRRRLGHLVEVPLLLRRRPAIDHLIVLALKLGNQFVCDRHYSTVRVNCLTDIQRYLSLFSKVSICLGAVTHIQSILMGCWSKHKIVFFDETPVELFVGKHVLLFNVNLIERVQEIYKIAAARRWTTGGLNNIFVVAAASASDDLHVLVGSMTTLEYNSASTADTAELWVSHQVLVNACCQLAK